MAKPSARAVKTAVIPSALPSESPEIDGLDEPASPGTDTPTVSRLSLPVTADGRIDGERLREKTRAALRRALSDPGLSASLGVTPLASTAGPSSADADLALGMVTGAVYDGASAAIVFLAARAGVPIEHARTLAFTPDDKKTLEAPTARVIQKYLPDLGGKYQDELVLALVLMNVIAGKVMLMRERQTQSTPAPSPAIEHVS